MSAFIEIENLSYAYPVNEGETPRPALDGVSLRIEAGSFTAVIGRNGSGKSTLAKQLNALLRPDAGRVLVDGLDTADEAQIWEIRRRVGMVFQNPDNQIVANVVEEDVAFGPENLGVPTDELEKRVNEVLKASGMEAWRYQSPNRLSGGQKQRVAIAGIMAMRPECIVLDEPTAMLDPAGRKYVLEAVHELNRRDGITIILITHYMEEAVNADRVIVMENGTIARDRNGNPLDAAPEKLFSDPEELERHALSVPVITELAWRLKKAGLDLPECVLTRKELVADLLRLKENQHA